jgi:hypothetical protein
MTKILNGPKVFMAVATGAVILTVLSSCVSSESSIQPKGKMAEIRRAFPSAIDMTEMPIDQAQINKINGPSGLLGYCVESKVVSRSGPFRIRVLLDPQLYVKRSTVISYPWDRGRDVCKPAFTDQFKGKGPADPIRLGEDIDAISGATISSRVMTEGVHDAIRLLKDKLSAGPDHRIY